MIISLVSASIRNINLFRFFIPATALPYLFSLKTSNQCYYGFFILVIALFEAILMSVRMKNGINRILILLSCKGSEYNSAKLHDR